MADLFHSRFCLKLMRSNQSFEGSRQAPVLVLPGVKRQRDTVLETMPMVRIVGEAALIARCLALSNSPATVLKASLVCRVWHTAGRHGPVWASLGRHRWGENADRIPVEQWDCARYQAFHESLSKWRRAYHPFLTAKQCRPHLDVWTWDQLVRRTPFQLPEMPAMLLRGDSISPELMLAAITKDTQTFARDQNRSSITMSLVFDPELMSFSEDQDNLLLYSHFREGGTIGVEDNVWGAVWCLTAGNESILGKDLMWEPAYVPRLDMQGALVVLEAHMGPDAVCEAAACMLAVDAAQQLGQMLHGKEAYGLLDPKVRHALATTLTEISYCL